MDLLALYCCENGLHV